MNHAPGPYRAAAPARSALVGNPSDGFGGAVLTVALANWSALVEVELVDGTEDRIVAEPGLARLAHAALGRARRRGWPVPTARVSVTTDIPREVGLAGSSAVIVATLSAAARAAGVEPSTDTLPAVALQVETDDLGIPGGLQDRIAQVHRGVVLCDLAETSLRWVDGLAVGAVERFDPDRLPELGIAWLPHSGESSARPHGELRHRWHRGDPVVSDGMGNLAELARQAADALRRREVAAIGPAMSASYDIRAAMVPLHPDHVALVEALRRSGAEVNYSGSGGAVVTTVPGGDLDALRAVLAPLGASIEALRPAAALG